MARAHIFAIVAVALGLVCGLVPAPPAKAKKISVTTTRDENGKGRKCSLREAIRAATKDRRFGGCPRGRRADTIYLREATYRLGGKPLTLRGRITIVGGGQTRTTIDGGGQKLRPVFLAAGGKHSIKNLAIEGGLSEGGGGLLAAGKVTVKLIATRIRENAAGLGGGIAAVKFRGGSAKVIVDSSVVSGNRAYEGGGIHVGKGTAVVVKRSSIVSFNDARRGGGIRSEGKLVVTDSAVDANDAETAADPGGSVGPDGGGIYSSGPKLTINRASVFSNDSEGHGGGLLLDGSAATITNATFGRNYTDGFGGGIATNNKPGESLKLINVTIGANRADNDGNGFGRGGGIASDVTTLKNTLIADNLRFHFDPTPAKDDCIGSFVSIAANEIENVDECGFSGAGTNYFGANIVLGNPRSSGNTGGSMYGPGRSAGKDCPGVDQDKAKRPKNGCSLGAVE